MNILFSNEKIKQNINLNVNTIFVPANLEGKITNKLLRQLNLIDKKTIYLYKENAHIMSVDYFLNEYSVKTLLLNSNISNNNQENIKLLFIPAYENDKININILYDTFKDILILHKDKIFKNIFIPSIITNALSLQTINAFAAEYIKSQNTVYIQKT